MSSIAEALTGGSAFIKWDELQVGATVTGTVTRTEVRQSTKFQSTEPDLWDDGKPKLQAIIGIATTLRNPEDPEDDGERSISINLWSGQKKALTAACKAAGVDEPKPGQQFSATWVSGVGKAGDPRVFVYTLGGVASDSLAAAISDTPPAPAKPDAATLEAINKLPEAARNAALASLGFDAEPPF